MKPWVEEVLFFHTVAIQQYGGAEGIRDSAALEAAVARPWTTFEGHEAFPTPFDKAAALCESIIQRHPFADGNKRTGISAGAYLLSTFCIEVNATSPELEDLAVSIATGDMDASAVSKWLEARTYKA